MKKILTITVAVLFLLPSAAQGMFFPAYTNMKKAEGRSVVLVKTTKDKLVTVYAPKTDKLFIEKAQLSSLYYICYENLLYETFITTKGRANFEYLRNALFDRYKETIFHYYGQAVHQSNSPNHCYWIIPDGGNFTLYLTLRYNPANEVATIRITYNPFLDYIVGDFSEKAAFNDEDDFIEKVTNAYRS
jgi:hypothetical protein